jgi:hypothetical protein
VSMVSWGWWRSSALSSVRPALPLRGVPTDSSAFSPLLARSYNKLVKGPVFGELKGTDIHGNK